MRYSVALGPIQNCWVSCILHALSNLGVSGVPVAAAGVTVGEAAPLDCSSLWEAPSATTSTSEPLGPKQNLDTSVDGSQDDVWGIIQVGSMTMTTSVLRWKLFSDRGSGQDFILCVSGETEPSLTMHMATGNSSRCSRSRCLYGNERCGDWFCCGSRCCCSCSIAQSPEWHCSSITQAVPGGRSIYVEHIDMDCLHHATLCSARCKRDSSQ
jgi:hypothetical protein